MNEIKNPPPPKEKPRSLEEIIKQTRDFVSVHKYTNPATNKIELVVIRCMRDGHKNYPNYRPLGDGFVLGAPPAPRPLYNRARVLKSDTIVVVEGEKAVEVLQSIGIVATTAPGGAGNAKYTDWSMLSGKECILWADNDPPDKNGHCAGARHMDDVQAILQGLEPPCKIKRIDETSLNLPPKGDAFEFVNAIPGTSEDKSRVVLDLLADAEPVSVSAGLFALIDDIASGRHQNIPFPWKTLSNLTNAILPGKVTVLVGSPGAGKSFFLDAMAIYWAEQNIKFSVYKLEDELPFHLNRILAQKSMIGQYLDPSWIKNYLEDVRNQAEKLRPFLDNIGRKIACLPPEGITLQGLAQWVEEKAKAGNRVIAVDPVTAATVKGNQWTADLDFMMRVKAACRDYGASLILVTHPKQKLSNNRESLIDNLAGGSAYQRFAHTILWIVNHDGKRVKILGKDGAEYEHTINRTVHLLKTRNGKGQGCDLGFEFDYDRLRFDEIGLLASKGEGKVNVNADYEEDSECPF